MTNIVMRQVEIAVLDDDNMKTNLAQVYQIKLNALEIASYVYVDCNEHNAIVIYYTNEQREILENFLVKEKYCARHDLEHYVFINE